MDRKISQKTRLTNEKKFNCRELNKKINEKKFELNTKFHWQ